MINNCEYEELRQSRYYNIYWEERGEEEEEEIMKKNNIIY